MIKRFLLRVIRQAVEEFLTPQFESLRAELVGKIEALRAELRGEMDKRFQAVDERFDQVEGRMKNMDERFDEIERRLGNIDEELRGHSIQLARLDQRMIDLKESLVVERRLARLEAHAGLARE